MDPVGTYRGPVNPFNALVMILLIAGAGTNGWVAITGRGIWRYAPPTPRWRVIYGAIAVSMLIGFGTTIVLATRH